MKPCFVVFEPSRSMKPRFLNVPETKHGFILQKRGAAENSGVVMKYGWPIKALGEVLAHRTPQDIMDEIAALDAESAEVLSTIRGML